MTLAGFTDYLCKHVLVGWKDDAFVDTQRIKKNNGVILTGIYIREGDSPTAPMVYIDELYEDFTMGRPLDDIINDFREQYEKAKQIQTFGNLDLSLYELVKDKIFLKLINYERNRDLLNGCPWIPFQDLAITFRWAASIDYNGIASALITNDFVERWGIAVDQMFEDAKKNTAKMLPPKVIVISQEPGHKLYAITNKYGVNGATTILSDDFGEEFHKVYPGEYFVFPSSIHELVLLEFDPNIDTEEFRTKVKHINDIGVPPDDVLSDNIYWYKTETREIRII